MCLNADEALTRRLFDAKLQRTFSGKQAFFLSKKFACPMTFLLLSQAAIDPLTRKYTSDSPPIVNSYIVSCSERDEVGAVYWKRLYTFNPFRRMSLSVRFRIVFFKKQPCHLSTAAFRLSGAYVSQTPPSSDHPVFVFKQLVQHIKFPIFKQDGSKPPRNPPRKNRPIPATATHTLQSR